MYNLRQPNRPLNVHSVCASPPRPTNKAPAHRNQPQIRPYLKILFKVLAILINPSYGHCPRAPAPAHGLRTLQFSREAVRRLGPPQFCGADELPKAIVESIVAWKLTHRQRRTSEGNNTSTAALNTVSAAGHASDVHVPEAAQGPDRCPNELFKPAGPPTCFAHDSVRRRGSE